jgi:dynein heavy chain
LDHNSIFAQVDAFVQRCKDLLDVCEGQVHFGRWQDGEKTPLPLFHGCRSLEIKRSLLEIESTFDKNLWILRNVKKSILDVKATSWHDDYNKFRLGVKDLESMVQNVILSAFETVATVEDGVELLEIFVHLSSREPIRRTLDKKTTEVWLMFDRELVAVKKELNAKRPFLTHLQPRFSGVALWARMLKRRIDNSMQVLENSRDFLPPAGVGDEARAQYKQLAQALEEFVSKMFDEWASTVSHDQLKKLEVPLMARSNIKAPMLDIRFDSSLLRLFGEIRYWDRLTFEIPHYASDVYTRREELRVLRENVLLVARDYNRILAMLSQEERGLFQERIKTLDKKIHPGLSKLTWASKDRSDFFLAECRKSAAQVQQVVDSYKDTNQAIRKHCRSVSEMLLVRIDGKRVYENDQFENDQEKHRQSVTEKLKIIHEKIVRDMKRTYEVFRRDNTEVQGHWYSYTEKMDRFVEEAFRLNVKWSLLELSRAINGDGKTSPNPLFRVRVVLEGKPQKVDFSPTLEKLAGMVNHVAEGLTVCASIIQRLPDLLTKSRSQKDPIYVVIENDEETRKVQQNIKAGMASNASHLADYLKRWDGYRDIYEISKDAFIRRYQRLSPPVSSFDGDIQRYSELSNNVQKEDTVLNIEFVLLDCSPLKMALVQHCNEWQNKFTNLLQEMATKQLEDLHNYLTGNAQKLSVPPQTLDELGDSLMLLEKMQTDLKDTEARFAPLHEQFNILEKYEVAIPEETRDTLENLNNEWMVFQQSLIDADGMLKKHKEKFRSGLLHDAEELKRTVAALCEDFATKGPFTSAVAVSEALDFVQQIRTQLANLKLQEAQVRRGLAIFKIEHPPSREVQNLDKDLDSLEAIWELVREWETSWDAWKQEKFKELVTDKMETSAQGMLKRCVRMNRELKEKNWEIIENLRRRIEQLKRTMPLIQALKNPAMRERHWSQLKTEVQKPFDQESDDFTLEKIIQLGLDEFADAISEISAAASKELGIEKALNDIKLKWDELSLDIGPYKDRGHFRLRATDEIFQTLEDNQVSLSTMKASRYVKAFESEVDSWERTLSHILECTEIILTVQRQWMYLENIFVGEDIRNQLPNESAMFDDVNGKWKTIMTRLNEERNALKGTHAEGLLETLSEMNVHLEEIQKSLDMYLETKRNVFPRFYFLSNDDLLEILGQSKNPEAVQPHLKKCFDNIVRLKLHKVRDKNEASCMISADGEEVDFQQAVLLEGAVETWLGNVERCMRLTLKEVLKACKTALKKQASKRDRWVKEWPGQMLITASQIQWTADCTKALKSMKERGDKKGLRSMKKKQVAMLGKFSESLRGNLTKLQRLKVVALVTIEVHARDVIERLIKAGCSDVNAFEWLMQLRLYWDEQIDDCIAKQTNTQFRYGYEYLGNSGRLVITPLTDRCYMTLTTALHLHRGGSPKGPAGTGKTETVKDLGKALGAYVIVVNCSEGLDYKSMGRMFSGLAQTGAWGCFDEFNRINIEVLSVVAQQILSILQALSRNVEKFMFEGRTIKLVWSCGIFITMNPGYAGRTELPDNLKSMFRPISMMVPDSRLIAEIILFGEGFGNCKVLANKVFTLYCLAVQQLSKQDHYDFGLRALVSVLRYGGRKRRANPSMPEEEVLLLAMKDMNVAKLTSIDLPLFNGIVSDLFPGVETPVLDYNRMYAAIKAELKLDGLQAANVTLLKVIQLFETKNSRHSTMIVGETGSGKSTVWRILQRSLTRLQKEQDEENKREKKDVSNPWHKVHAYPINPKAVSLGELYGEFDLNTNEWTDGILSTVMRQACADERPDQKWIVFDAPVDTLWIESMNSVMDDNKILTLINGERISMPEQVSLLIETQDLAVASPATVSRCGMVFLDTVDLGWRPYVESWLQKHDNRELAEHLQRLFDKFVDKLLVFRQKSCKELVPTAQLNSVISLCTLFNALATPENGVNPEDPEHYLRMVELWFLFSMIWSICASVDEQSRKKMDNYIRELEGQFPSKDTVYEYYVDVKQKGWTLWEEKLRSGWRYNSALPFYKIMVPTVDTVRYDFIVHSLISARRPVLLVGPVGTGKTSVAQSVLSKLDPRMYSVLTINMSAQTSSNNVQEIIESKVEKRTKGVFVPSGGKKMITFLDDLNMPTKDTFGSQPPLELLRMWLDYGFWYDRQKQTKKEIRDMFLLAAMGPPGGGRQVISRRLQGRFNLLNMTFPHESQIKRIFGTMINQKLQDFEEDVKPIGDIMTQATVEIYEMISTRMLPTPTKIHYLFNLRDISKVFQGLLRAHKDYHDTKAAMTRLWVHECFRVFSDRLVDSRDAEMFKDMLNEKLGTLFDVSFYNLCPNKQSPIFGDFLRVDNAVYEDIMDFKQLKSFMEASLEDYNNTAGVIAMDLVLFKDAIEHVCRVVRVIRQPRGNMLLVGIGGSGRQSLTRLAAYILEYEVFQIEISRHYRQTEFREDLRKLYATAGVDNKPTVFLFTDTQVVEETFLEDINNILSSGEVPNLYKPEEFEEVRSALADVAKKDGIVDVPDVMFAYFIERVRNNLHVVLCMSPVGEPFRNRIRQYPAFVNCTTIDWFSEWPKDALLEVSERYLEEVNLGTGDAALELKKNVAQIFVTVHRSVVDKSRQMLLEMKRYNYVTPTNYLELVSGYKRLLEEKRKELGDAASKLKNGLFKLDETREKVQAMSVELEEAKVKVAEYQKQCEEYLVIIVQQKREADEQQKSVSARSEKIAEEETECKKIADNAQKDLEAALPALEEAMKALEALNKKDLTEIKSYGSPPELVGRVLQAVMILRGAEPTWAEAKRQLSDPNFIKQLIHFDKDNMSDRMLKKINGYTSQQDFKPEIIGRVSQAARSLSMWVIAMEVYGKVFRVVQPKREKLAEATKKLEKAQAQLADAKAKLQEVQDKIEELKRQYDEKLAQKEELRRKAEETELKLERAGKLVSGLAGERERWEASVGDLEEQIGYLVGDCLVASACLSYIGPFLSQYREELVQKIWLQQVRELNVPCNPDFTFALFLSRPTTVRGWNIQGLPSDSFSTENGVIVTRGSRWPLMVDPQGQAMKWVKNMEGKRLKIIDLQQPDFLRTLENSIQFGSPVLLQNVQEELDPSLAPVLNKSIFKVAGRLVIRLGDKEIDYSPDFKFYITTKLSNPHYTPEISTKTTIVNFAVKEQGLEAQLLGIVVRKERPDLEEKKSELVVNIASGKKRLEELEDEILRLLSTAQGSLLDDEKLVETLQSSKTTALEVAEQLQVSEQTEVKIDAAREGYRPCAQRASILFFVLNDMGRIDPMYQFSLDAYIELFNMSIDKSQKSAKLEERIKSLNDHHTYAVYRFTCRGLFERHKLLFSFQMCAKILEAASKLNMEEYNFFLRGGIVLDRETQMDNPCTEWLPDTCWDHITELDKLSSFQGLSNSFEQNGRAWRQWYTAAEPETSVLPGEWENSLNELQRMLVVRSLRSDRVQFCATSFIVNNLGPKFVEPPVLDMKSVVDDSNCRTPLIFVLSPGVDPTSALLQLAEHSKMSDRFQALSLGQGQAPIAKRMFKTGVKDGDWVFLANCHLSLSWMPELDKLVEQLQTEEPHKDFRLWLSSSPHPDFPISILQAGIKMTTEPPKGLKANMKRLYQLVTDEQFNKCHKPDKYKKLLFSLAFFHSVLIERRKFGMLGWNVFYGFNDSDFEVSENLLSIYLDEYEETQWDALKYLIAEVNYGGHVTDDWDRRLLLTYINNLFCDNALTIPFYKLSSLPTYYLPRDGPLNSYRDYIHQLPNIDHPEAFGQNPNADISSQIRETRALFETLLSLQPQISVSEGASSEDKVLELAAEVQAKVPEEIDYEQTVKLLADDPSPLNVVLLQEIERYNALVSIIRTSLIELEKAIKGVVVMSSDLEETFSCIHDARVPPLWEKAYPSLKPLGPWTRDLQQRVEQFAEWAKTTRPPHIFWLSGFTFPTGFLTAVLQTAARQNNVSVDTLSWEFHVSTLDDSNITGPPKDGVWIRGLYLEGAGWDKKNSCLIEASPMQLVCPVPSIHFKPAENKKKAGKGTYACPCYYYSNRSGTSGRPSFIVGVELKAGAFTADHWIKRAVALLMSLDY